MIKELEMERLSWIIWGDPKIITGVLKKRAEGDVTPKEEKATGLGK